jgi:hypothetical protein
VIYTITGVSNNGVAMTSGSDYEASVIAPAAGTGNYSISLTIFISGVSGATFSL